MDLQNKPAQLLEKVQGDGNLWKKKDKKCHFFRTHGYESLHIFYVSENKFVRNIFL